MIRIAPKASKPFSVAMTRAEFEKVFSSILQTGSWRIGRYNFRMFPPRAHPFLVESGMPPAVIPALRNPKAKRLQPQAAPNALEESAQYLGQVAAWRMVWRPDQVRVLLIAESHVAEEQGDGQVAVRLPFATSELLPGRFCRLVYCLGYGEDGICDPPPPAGNSGTRQYWRIFAEIAGLEPPTKISFPLLAGRLAHRLAILRELRKRGIWLVDASTRALYRTRRKGKPRHYVQIIQRSWQERVWPSVANENPDLICVIGRGVFSAIGHRPELQKALVITQPQDRDNNRFRQGMSRLLQAIRAVEARRRHR